MDYYEAVAAQPTRLEASAATVRAALAALDLTPWRTGLLAVVSMGASSHAGHAFALRLARHGRRVVNVTASALLDAGRGDLADCYLFVSEGGRSRETIEAAQLARGPRLALTNEPSSPLAQVADAVIELGHGEDSKVYSVGYTATLQALGLLASALDGIDDGDDWAGLPAQLAALIGAPLDGAALDGAALFDGVSSIDFVGAGASYAAAAEGALLLRESARISTATYETYQYLHGPMEPLEASSGCVLFGDGREVALARYVAGAGVRTVLITTADVPSTAGLQVVRVPAAPGLSRAVLEIAPVQVIAGELARDRGLGIDGFRHHQDDTKVDEVPAS